MNRMSSVYLAAAALLLTCVQARAGEPAVNLAAQNPAIEKLQARMRERAEKVRQWKDKGATGEEATGLLKQFAVAGQDLAQKKEVRDLVLAENEDRAALFRELVLVNCMQEKDLEAVARAYAKTMRQTAAAGHLVQDPATNQWLKKQATDKE